MNYSDLVPLRTEIGVVPPITKEEEIIIELNFNITEYVLWNKENVVRSSCVFGGLIL